MNFENQTKYPAGWTLGFEPDGRELLVVVVKATFGIPDDGSPPKPNQEQVPLTEADEFTGEPGYSATLYESDYAHRKPFCDVLLNGSAYAPAKRPAERVTVSLQVGSMKKAFNVLGDRRWDRIMMQNTPSLPVPFMQKKISYDNAFGGTDADIGDKHPVKTYALNPIGVGYYPISSGKQLEGKPLANTEEIGHPVRAAKTGNFRPMSFGALGRNFLSRLQFAGTYDRDWLDRHAPFWPDNFDYRYFQAASQDQRIAHPKGGEPVILKNLTPQGITAFALPAFEVPVLLIAHRDKPRQVVPIVDTLLFEPDLHRFTLTSRISLPLKRNCFELKDVVIGETLKRRQRRQRAGNKPYFKGLAQFTKTKKDTGA